jgi:hypothetical protein
MRLTLLSYTTYVLAGIIAVAWASRVWIWAKRTSVFGEERLLKAGPGRGWFFAPILSIAGFFALANALGSLPSGPKPLADPIEIVIDRQSGEEAAGFPADELELAVRSILDQAPGSYFGLSLQGESLEKIVPSTSDATGLLLVIRGRELGSREYGQIPQAPQRGPKVHIRAQTNEALGGSDAVVRISSGQLPAWYWVPGAHSWSTDPSVLQQFLYAGAAAESENWLHRAGIVFHWGILAFICIFAETVWKVTGR